MTIRAKYGRPNQEEVTSLKKALGVVWVCLPLLLVGQPATAQSTTPWVPVAVSIQTPGATEAPRPKIGATYLTVEFLASRINQNSNWWTNLIEKNRQAVVDVTVSGQFGTSGRFEDVRTSAPIELKKGTGEYDVGWSQRLVEKLPTTYSSLQMKVRVSKTSRDGLQALISTVSELSSASGMQISQATLGTVSAVKAIADFLFNKRLLEEKLRSAFGFPNSGDSLPAGVYASLSADTEADCARYLSAGPAGGLAWTGTQLKWNGAPVSGVTYFVVRVSYQGKIFEDPLDALSFSTVKPWASLYSIGRGKIATIAQLQDEEKVGAEIRAHLINGNALLDNDPDYIFLEREAIKDAVLRNTQKLLVARHELLAPRRVSPGAPDPAGGGGGGGGGGGREVAPVQPFVSPPPIVLSSPDDLRKTDELKRMIYEESKKRDGNPQIMIYEDPKKVTKEGVPPPKDPNDRSM